MRAAYLLVLFVLLVTSSNMYGQTKHALFLGNSYTAVNNLPSLTAEVALSMGDTLIYDSNTPGGYTLEGHTTNTTSQNKIAQGNWDFVILQEQSQRPSFPDAQVAQEVFPYAEVLDTTINYYNDCAETVFYMTWGRENGDAGNCASWPPVCTYEGMDSLLALRYAQMAEMNDALLSPVGAVWHSIRDSYPEIDLYSSDGSHPSVAGTYAGAVTFYTVLFREDPSLIPFDHTLDALIASQIRSAVHEVVYQNLEQWHIGEYDLSANFSYSQLDTYTYEFSSEAANHTGIEWLYNESQEELMTITFPGPGEYEIVLYAYDDCTTVSTSQTINIPLVPDGVLDLTSGNNVILSGPVAQSIELPELLWGMDLKIINLSGMTIKSRTAGRSSTWNVSSLSSGVYVLIGTDDNGKRIQVQFLKE